jgi:hypothetical protein
MGQPVQHHFKPNAENAPSKTANTLERSINKTSGDKMMNTGLTHKDGQEETKIPTSFTQGENIKVDLGDSMGPVEE